MADAALRARVPVAEVSAEAYRAVFGRLDLFLEIAWAPLLILLTATLLPGYLIDYVGWGRGLGEWGAVSVGPGQTFAIGLPDVITAVASLFCLSAFAVRWHQIMLFSGPRNLRREIFLPGWGRFVLYTILFYCLAGGLLAVLFIAGAENGAPSDSRVAIELGATAIGVSLWIILLRCSLLFPSAAYGRPLGLGEAWRLMRGNSWRLLGCGILTCTPIVLSVVFLLSALVATLHFDSDPARASRAALGLFILRGLTDTLVNFLVVALGASVLSGFYRRLVMRGVGLF